MFYKNIIDISNIVRISYRKKLNNIRVSRAVRYFHMSYDAENAEIATSNSR